MSSSSGARAGLGLAALAVLTIPVAVAASWAGNGLTLLRALEFGVPVAFVLGLAAFAVVRRARYRLELSVTRPGAGLVRSARLLAWAGLYLATAGAIALGFYGLLVLRG
ncbi:MAG: hypothetical protein JO186_08450 [Actinobacteria bacterium]|nr:hypothetical protein [Actinomycetota bacterium]MBV8394802.1 hypothetical protein [Actinomycetota bacterium]MBV8597695.1 hypothetical protein [Actinomycetota bacterium]